MIEELLYDFKNMSDSKKLDEYKRVFLDNIKLTSKLNKYKNSEHISPAYNNESERVQYIMKNWSHLQLARDYEELEKTIQFYKDEELHLDE